MGTNQQGHLGGAVHSSEKEPHIECINRHPKQCITKSDQVHRSLEFMFDPGNTRRRSSIISCGILGMTAALVFEAPGRSSGEPGRESSGSSFAFPISTTVQFSSSFPVIPAHVFCQQPRLYTVPNHFKIHDMDLKSGRLDVRIYGEPIPSDKQFLFRP